MDSYNKFLAENVLTEDKVITYRVLSQALQVHVNTAKQNQNAKRPGAVHATYLVYGTKKATNPPSESQDGADGDIEMSSSAMEVDSLTEVVPASVLSLVPEDQLKDTLADYEEVTSIHVYSIAPHPTKDMALLVDAANQMLTPTTSEDVKHTVPITNPWVRRRERQGAALRAAAAAAVVKPPTKPAFPNVKEESKPTQPIQEAAPKPSTSGPTKKPAPSLKRGGNSGIMQAFSKTATKPTKVKKEAEVATPSSEDSSMQPLSDDGEDDEELPQPKPRAGSGFKTKRQREEDLRRMMEEDDEEEEVEEKEETPEEEPMEEEEPPAPEPVKEEEAEVVTASTDGRRRGKRRIMRKKQIMDDQGYLVTIQEPGWESFSEDEAPPPTKPKTTSAASSQAAKPKKGGPKGQGNIMAFFSKK
ncbi:hypothetical protein CHGG_04568 [Chaetomium globosum CBS 148.51]|uniref:DNA polymerase delta subunit 3 n=1 Tax=Chaetomium globosum (strain ATCC 6205 / CBS 148.51 / DSM 1962 / NBRC 6347 / NRRL 1970) TaxID=306901 RepID=Q2H0X8_CHAGB|nr:uncharacterized protein CHGG_04568 [Chaetomium globosum CBS 148.51]EAQ87949.1 hypothetical protein CHGG_04568 [Chaetomium globosum CBS 148.51]